MIERTSITSKKTKTKQIFPDIATHQRNKDIDQALRTVIDHGSMTHGDHATTDAMMNDPLTGSQPGIAHEVDTASTQSSELLTRSPPKPPISAKSPASGAPPIVVRRSCPILAMVPVR
jgi:hypothetical protein